MPTKTMKKTSTRRLYLQRYQKKIESARQLAASIDQKMADGLAFVFPAFIYRQLRREYR